VGLGGPDNRTRMGTKYGGWGLLWKEGKNGKVWKGKQKRGKRGRKKVVEGEREADSSQLEDSYSKEACRNQ